MNELQKQILSNFKNDIRDYIIANLDAEYLKETYDISLNPKLDLTQINNLGLFTLYYFFRRRFPTGIKRVLFSRELMKNPLFKKYRKQTNKIVAALNTGKNIREYLPKDIGNLNTCNPRNKKTDGLLIGWDIAHLHLFTRKERIQLKVENKNDDKYLLYIISDSQSVFLIDIQDHKHIVNIDLLNIIKNNIGGAELQGFFDNIGITASDFDKTLLKGLRNSGVAHLIKLNDNGDSFMSGLHTTSATIAYQHILEQLSSCASWVVENIDSIKTDLSKYEIDTDKINFHLGFGQGLYLGKRKLSDVFVYDKTSGAVLNFPENKPIEMVINILKNANII